MLPVCRCESTIVLSQETDTILTDRQSDTERQRERGGQTETHKYRHTVTDRHGYRQTDRSRERQTDRQKDTERQTDFVHHGIVHDINPWMSISSVHSGFFAFVLTLEPIEHTVNVLNVELCSAWSCDRSECALTQQYLLTTDNITMVTRCVSPVGVWDHFTLAVLPWIPSKILSGRQVSTTCKSQETEWWHKNVYW